MKNKKNKIFIYFLVIFFAFFVGTSVFLVISNKKNPAKNQPQQASATYSIKEEKLNIPTTVPSRGLINLKLTDTNVSNFVNGNLVNLTLTGDSDNEDVTAFDVLINFDPLAFDFVSAQSTLPLFKIYSFVKNNRLTLTVVKTSLDKIPTVFKETSLANLVFKSKKTGRYNFGILPSSGQETTKFVNTKTEIIYPSINSINVTVN